jgi:hypothetical protein
MEFWDFITDPYSWWASEARFYILLAIVFCLSGLLEIMEHDKRQI